MDEDKQHSFLINSEKKFKDIIKPYYQKERVIKKNYGSIYPTESSP